MGEQKKAKNVADNEKVWKWMKLHPQWPCGLDSLSSRAINSFELFMITRDSVPDSRVYNDWDRKLKLCLSSTLWLSEGISGSPRCDKLLLSFLRRADVVTSDEWRANSRRTWLNTELGIDAMFGHRHHMAHLRVHHIHFSPFPPRSIIKASRSPKPHRISPFCDFFSRLMLGGLMSHSNRQDELSDNVKEA
jgi:hypothetical protein